MSNRQCCERQFRPTARAVQQEDGVSEEQWVEGYAVVFNSPTVLWECDGCEYKEQIDRTAFDAAKMDDVIFNYNHTGKVMARTRNKTLELEVDEKGLFVRARLDGTAEGREIYANIRDGYIDRMSFQFTIEEESYNGDEHMWTVRGIKRLYDVSAVDIPAYDDTSIEARKASLLEAEAQEREQAAEAAIAVEMLELKLKLKEY
ncbi:hypothetical protein SAMN04515656_11213 [Eubacterium aggregans]|uniref:Prohead serine protease domain-containing protein n=1 Tax=Eubacterium aggregans TaxID=81409 RepID=A0A1H4BNA2_9FIRM|nr:HK97 family phage prohead protease [Eubacterium aggregans]SEA49655.1 hypothetical protein SAMN04515656_11213 [Eubacterium aggregans]